jgi:hypothetical protein
MTELLRIGANIATPLGGFGLLVVVLLIVYQIYLKYKERQLQRLPEDQRAKAIDDMLSRYNLDAKNLTREQKYELLIREMDHKAKNVRLA